MNKRTNRSVSKHTRRRTLEDSLGTGKLNVDGMEDGYYYHVVTDKNGRVDELKARGYEVVEHNGIVSMGDSNAREAGTAVQTTADSKDGTKAVLMRCPQEFKDEDDAFRAKQIDKGEEALYRNAKEEKGRYGDIEIE